MLQIYRPQTMAGFPSFSSHPQLYTPKLSPGIVWGDPGVFQLVLYLGACFLQLATGRPRVFRLVLAAHFLNEWAKKSLKV